MTVNEMFLICMPERTASIAARRTAGALMLSVSPQTSSGKTWRKEGTANATARKG